MTMNFDKMSASEMNDWYEQTVGYRPQVDNPTMSDDELRCLCISYIDAVALEATWINVRREQNRVARSRGFRNYAEMSEYVA